MLESKETIAELKKQAFQNVKYLQEKINVKIQAVIKGFVLESNPMFTEIDFNDSETISVVVTNPHSIGIPDTWESTDLNINVLGGNQSTWGRDISIPMAKGGLVSTGSCGTHKDANKSQQEHTELRYQLCYLVQKHLQLIIGEVESLVSEYDVRTAQSILRELCAKYDKIIEAEKVQEREERQKKVDEKIESIEVGDTILTKYIIDSTEFRFRGTEANPMVVGVVNKITPKYFMFVSEDYGSYKIKKSNIKKSIFGFCLLVNIDNLVIEKAVK